jgi:hypothetical protein
MSDWKRGSITFSRNTSDGLFWVGLVVGFALGLALMLFVK